MFLFHILLLLLLRGHDDDGGDVRVHALLHVHDGDVHAHVPHYVHDVLLHLFQILVTILLNPLFFGNQNY